MEIIEWTILKNMHETNTRTSSYFIEHVLGTKGKHIMCNEHHPGTYINWSYEPVYLHWVEFLGIHRRTNNIQTFPDFALSATQPMWIPLTHLSISKSNKFWSTKPHSQSKTHIKSKQRAYAKKTKNHNPNNNTFS